MPSIASFCEPVLPVSADVTGEALLARFREDPGLTLLAVVEDGRPVGAVLRDAFLLSLSDPAVLGRRAGALMDPDPTLVEISTSLSSLHDTARSEAGAKLMAGFIVTERGLYVGVVGARALLDLALRGLDEAARAKSQFLAVMSHEIRTPMNGVLAVAELLQRQPLGPDAQAYVQTIIDSSETLLRVLADAVDLSRAEAGELEMSPRPTFLRELMDDAHAVWTPRAAQDGVNLMVSYDGDPDLACEIDGVRLGQVFNNLIGNALRFARNGVVEASLRAVAGPDGRVRLEGRVRDTGHGIAADRLDTIFDPFAPGPDEQAGGMGLGLSICRQILETMGGRIWASSNTGHGATFAFELHAPRARLERPGESNVAELEDLHLHAAPHVLIVDDNATNRVVAQALCEMFGCTSECAEDGMEAVEAVQNRRFDLVLMDIKMPRMDGVQATEAIRALPGVAREVPIIALTANADPEDARRYLGIGMSAVVEKPIKPERLRAAMNQALDGEGQSDSGFDTGRTAVA